MSFDHRVRKYLGVYPSGATGQGIWKKHGIPYPHILPESERALNILEPYRDVFWAWVPSQRRVKLHRDFHHLNSSQALCFNLFAPFILENRVDILCGMLNVSSLKSDSNHFRFEAVFDTEEGTNFDFFLQPNRKLVCISRSNTLKGSSDPPQVMDGTRGSSR